MKQKRVILFTVADPEIGLGHLYRCDALAQAMNQIGAVVSLCIESHSGVEWLNSKQIVSDYLLKSWSEDSLLIRQLERRNDLFIIDSYNVSTKVWVSFSNTNIPITVFDDYGEKPFLQGFLVNGSPGAKFLHYSKNKERTLLLGTDYQVLRQPFWNMDEKTIQENLQLVVVMLGGTDHLNISQKIVDILKAVLPTKTRIVIISGKIQDDDRIEHISFLSASGVKNIFLEADLLISAAGQTVAEAVSTELPLVIIQTTENQELNYRGWAEKGVCITGGILEDEDFLKIFLLALQKAIDYNYRKKMFNNSQMLNLKDSTLRLAKLLLGAE